MGLNRAVKSPQGADGSRHRLRRNNPAFKYTLAEPRDLSIFMQGLQAVVVDGGNLEAN